MAILAKAAMKVRSAEGTNQHSATCSQPPDRKTSIPVASLWVDPG